MKQRSRMILYVEHMADVGGGQISLLEILRRIDRQRYTPVVTCVTRGELFDQVKALGVDCEIVDIRGVLRKSPLRTIGNMRALYRLMRDRGVDLIHFNSLKALLIACVPALLTRVPAIWHCRVTSDYGKFFDLVGCLCAKRIVVPSRFLLARFNWQSICRGKVRLIYNAAELDGPGMNPPAMDIRDELGIPSRAFVVGCAGRMEEEKGYHLLVEAVCELACRLPDLRLVVVGGEPVGGTYRERLREMVSGSDMASRVHFTGYRRDIRRYLAAMDVVAVPSEREVFGRVAVEAMALGKPVVASSAGGLPEVVEDGVTGILFPPGDVAALSEALARLSDDRDAAAAMGEAGRRRAMELFDMRKHVREIETLYDEILHEYGDIPEA